MTETVLWTGCIVLAGTLGAMAARAVRLPAACGAMAGGLLTSVGVNSLGLMPQALDLLDLRAALVAFVCLLAGVEIDLTRLVKDRRSIAAAVGAQCLLVGGLVALAGLMLGYPPRISLLLAVCLMATSPTALMAVASELRASGHLTRRLLAQSGIGLLAALALMHFVFFITSPQGEIGSFLLSVVVGAVMGFVILVPLSRMSQRGAMVTGAATGALVLALVARGLGPRLEQVAAMSIIAGFIVGNFSSNRDSIRDALRDVGLPCVIALFAVAGFGLQAGELAAGLGSGLALLAARAAGLMLAGAVTPGGGAGIVQGLAQLPAAGITSGGALAAMTTMSLVAAATAVPALWEGFVVAAAASELFGMIAARWVLARAGEAPLAEQVTVR